jgi:hypothetical protein
MAIPRLFSFMKREFTGFSDVLGKGKSFIA